MKLHRRALLSSAGTLAVGGALGWPRLARAFDGVCAGSLSSEGEDDSGKNQPACDPVVPTFAKSPKYLVVCIAKGGWDTTFSFDPKTGNPYHDGPEVDSNPLDPTDVERTVGFGREANDETLASPGPGMILKTNLKRNSVEQFFSRWWPATAVVNGQWTGSIVHQPCRIRLLTGTTDSFNPDFATIFGFEQGTGLPLGSVDFSGLSYSGQLAASTGRIGFNAQLKTLLDPTTLYPEPTSAAGSYVLPLFRRDPEPIVDSEEDVLIRRIIEDRVSQMRASVGNHLRNGQRLDDMLQALERRRLLYESGSNIVADLILGEEPDMALQACVGVDLLQKGLCRAVTMQHFDSWDTHKGNVLQHERYESFFDVLDLLMCQLEATGLLADTMVVVCSEMGRTPRLNVGGGKDHWAHTTQLLIGAGVKGGFTYGATSDGMESLPVDLATGMLLDTADGGELNKYDNFVSGLLSMMNIEPAKWLPLAFPFVGAKA